MGFNKRKMEDQRRHLAEKEAKARASEKQILEDADHLITVWNERQAKRMPMLFPDDRRRHHGGLLVPASALPGLPQRVELRSLECKVALLGA